MTNDRRYTQEVDKLEDDIAQIINARVAFRRIDAFLVTLERQGYFSTDTRLLLELIEDRDTVIAALRAGQRNSRQLRLLMPETIGEREAVYQPALLS